MGLARLTLLHIHGDGAQQAIRLGLAMYRAQEILAQHIVEAAADGQIRQAANELAILHQIGQLHGGGKVPVGRGIAAGGHGHVDGPARRQLRQAGGGRINIEAMEAQAGHTVIGGGRCAKVFSGDRLLGVLGQVHPHVAGNYGVDTELYAAELRFDALYESKGAQPVYQPLPKFPAVTRDIAVVCDKAVTVGELEDAIRKGAKGLLKDAALFDIYTGTGIAPGKKSVAFNLTLRADDRSLTAEEADADVKSILTALEQECGAVLR